jgi:RHS repeat-associated protein
MHNANELDNKTNYTYFWTRYYDSELSAWLSVDPMSDKYPSLSPYCYSADNPVVLVDPNGMDIWEINDQGEIVSRTEDKSQDKFIIVSFDSEGNKVEGPSKSFEYGTVTDVRTPTVNVEGTDTKLTMFEIKGDKNATELFEFFADPDKTSVEWTHAKIGTESSEKNIVGTSHDESSTAVGHYLRKTGYTLREVNHNHPGGDYLPSKRDKQGAEEYKAANPNVKLQIYTHPNRYSEYDEKGTLDFSVFGPTIIIIETKNK